MRTKNPEQGFEAMFGKHRSLVYRTAFSITRSHQDAEDVLQNVFIKVLRRDDHATFARNLEGYLYRAAVNEARDIVRARTPIASDLESAEGSILAESIVDDERRETLQEAIAKLKPDELSILLLRYQQGYSDAEIAEMLGCSRVKVAVTLYRIRSRLKALVGEIQIENIARQLTTEGGLR
jgi:RNA polymerase sigma-70 factor (ECF subfamily)